MRPAWKYGMGLAQAARILRRHPRYFVHLLRRRADFAARYRWVRRHGAGDRRRPRPLVYKLMLNWGCNLRCPMCMLWGEEGWLKQVEETAKASLPWPVVQKVFDSELGANDSFILSGGEPLMYERFGDILRLLRARRKFAIVCTNGLLLDRYLDELDGNPYPTFLLSLDGPEEINDRLRGKGVYARLMRNLEKVQALRRPPFVGIQFTVMPENVAVMESFCEEMVARGVDWILLNPGWFLSPQQAKDYEHFMGERFGVDPTTHLGYLQEYEYDKDELVRQLERIWSRSWPIQIACHLKSPEWVHDFIDTPDKILGNSLCYKQWLRLDVLPDGKVAPCVQFPDLTVGDLGSQGIDEVWQGEANRGFQRVAHRETLPICAKCNAIYQYG